LRSDIDDTMLLTLALNVIFCKQAVLLVRLSREAKNSYGIDQFLKAESRKIFFLWFFIDAADAQDKRNRANGN